jgi:predicted RNA-binding protein with EMAP domain
MKKILLSLIAVLSINAGLTAQQDAGKENKTGISKSEMQERVSQSVDQSITETVTEESRQAVEILQETQQVIGLIAEKKNKEAEEKLAGVIGKLEILLAKYPEMSLIPVNSTVEVHDVIADVKSVEDVMKQVREAIEKGYYQQAKWLLNDLSSEMIIKTAYLPMATYPAAMKLAAKLMSENKNEEAVGVLVKALTTLVVKEDILPLPVLRAQEFIFEALAVMDNDKTFKENKETLLALLDAAEYQLKLAEAMGYGKKDKEYKELADAIDDLKSLVEKGKEKKTRKALNKLSDKLETFKKRLFPVKPKK